MISVMKDNEGWTLIIAGTLAAVAVSIGEHRKTPYDDLFEESAAKYGVDPNLLRAIAKHESGMRPTAISGINTNGTKDYGLMQINERTAKAMKVAIDDLLNPRVSIDTAGKLLRAMKSELGQYYNPFTLISAYNVGSPTVVKNKGKIVNVSYTSSVWYHWQSFAIGGIA